MYRTLELERAGAVATVWLNRPAVHNAFNAELIAELSAVFGELGNDESMRVMVLAGRGESFSAGADLNWMKAAAAASMAENREDARRLAEMLRRLAELERPTIARVHGAALGGGMGLAAACDICVASEKASFAAPEVKVGIIPATISPYVIRAIGERQAYRYFQTAERISAARAGELGLAHEVVGEDALDAKVGGIVAALLQGGPKAQIAVKGLLRAVANRPVGDEVVEETARRIAALRATPEAKEGLDAFLAKRPAPWVPQR